VLNPHTGKHDIIVGPIGFYAKGIRRLVLLQIGLLAEMLCLLLELQCLHF
jgi:hypothetical protein